MTFTGLILLLVAAVAALPAAVLLVECLASLLPAPRPPAGKAGTAPTVALLMPAHDEELGVGDTVAALVPQLGAGDRLIVVADNCTDQTAARAIAAGGSVIERTDTSKRGKGFAIQFGLEHLDAKPPDVVVLVDADCRVGPGGVKRLAALAAGSGRPVQAEYLLGAPANPSPLAVVNALALLVRNRVRPRGLHRLGLPCQLTGSGMAFPWKVLREAPPTGANLVEDLVMGLDMAERGDPPLLCPEVPVTSELPAGSSAAMKQRRRWEHGQLQTLVKYGPRLVARGVFRARPDLLGLGLDLLVPPLAMLVVGQIAVMGLTAVAWALGLAGIAPVLVAAGGLAAVGLAVILGWLRFARKAIPAKALVFVPFYVLWKIPLYFSLLLGRKQKTWERTERAAEAGREKPAGE